MLKNDIFVRVLKIWLRAIYNILHCFLKSLLFFLFIFTQYE